MKVVRLSAKSREHLDSDVEHLALHSIVQNMDTEQSRQLRMLLEKKEKSENQLNNSDMKKLTTLRKKLEKQVLKAADVICCTCSGAGDPRLQDLKFKQVIAC